MTLLIDFLKGLKYLHDEKGVIHRDINPDNLGVVSLDPPHGVLLNFDAATRETASEDYRRGLTPYLAPEMIDLRVATAGSVKVRLYGRGVDVWALGLSMFAMHIRRPSFSWTLFDDPDTSPQMNDGDTSSTVLWHKHNRFCSALKLKKRKDGFASDNFQLLELIEHMTEWDPATRVTAAELLDFAEHLEPAPNQGRIVPKSGVKRSVEELWCGGESSQS